MNGRDINRVINAVIPVSSEVIGSPRNSLEMEKYYETFPESTLFKKIDLMGKENYRIPDFFYPRNIRYPIEFFVGNLKDARVWGRNGAVISANDHFITDVSREFDEGKNVKHSIFYTLRQKKASKVTGNAAVIGTAGAYVYYHWMLDVLPRLSLLSQVTELETIDHFIAEYNGYDFQKETLAKLDIPEKKIIASNDNWNFHIRAENLFVPSLVGPIGQPTAFQIQFLRNLYKNEMNEGTGFRKIYISRRITGRRMITNEDEIIPLLKEIDFEIIDCEALSVATQVKIFSEASVVISSHGSAFTNLVFCNRETKVLDILNTTHTNPCFWIICHFLNLDYYYLSGESIPVNDNSKSDHTKIDKEVFLNTIIKMGITP